jgi:hypothetical protein
MYKNVYSIICHTKQRLQRREKDNIKTGISRRQDGSIEMVMESPVASSSEKAAMKSTKI